MKVKSVNMEKIYKTLPDLVVYNICKQLHKSYMKDLKKEIKYLYFANRLNHYIYISPILHYDTDDGVLHVQIADEIVCNFEEFAKDFIQSGLIGDTDFIDYFRSF